MPRFIIVTSCTAISEYVVDADTKEAAQELYENGNFLSDTVTDYHDEEVIEVRSE